MNNIGGNICNRDMGTANTDGCYLFSTNMYSYSALNLSSSEPCPTILNSAKDDHTSYSPQNLYTAI